jgi:hypothetical protein
MPQTVAWCIQQETSLAGLQSASHVCLTAPGLGPSYTVLFNPNNDDVLTVSNEDWRRGGWIWYGPWLIFVLSFNFI